MAGAAQLKSPCRLTASVAGGYKRRVNMDRKHPNSHPKRRTIPWWAFGVVVVVVVAALRIPWLEADAGNRGFYTYGFFTGDEGGYGGGGRMAYLTGKFVDPELGEPHTFTVSWGMHWLSYWGYKLTGLSYGAMRWPAMVVVMLGWLAAFRLAARWTVPWLATAVTVVMSCNPMSLTYERVASTDAVIGALMVVAYLLVTSRRIEMNALAGLPVALALSIKTTAVALLPLLLLGMIVTHRRNWQRWLVVAGSAVVGCALVWGWLWWCLRPVGGLESEAAQEFGRGRVPVAFKPGEWIRALSVFPRWPFSSQLGPLVVALLVLPAWLGLVAGRRRAALGWGVVIFLAAMATQAHAALRYFESVVFFVPALLVASRIVFPRARRSSGIIVVALGVMVAAFWLFLSVAPAEAEGHLYGEYVLPKRVSWELTWWRWLAAVVVVAGTTVTLGFGKGRGARGWLLAVGLALPVVWVFLSNHVICAVSKEQSVTVSQLLIQFAAGLLLLCLWRGRPGWRWWYGAAGLICLLSALFNHHWRTAYPELGRRTMVTRTAASKLAEQLPAEAIVVGRRAPTLLRQTRCGLGLAFPGYKEGEFRRRLEELAAKYPQRPLYWLLESDAMPWYYPPMEEMAKAFEIKPVAQVMVPADGSLNLIPVYLLRLTKKPA